MHRYQLHLFQIINIYKLVPLQLRHCHPVTFTYLKAEKPPKSAPLAMPTQKPIVKPVFILSKHEGPCWPNALLGIGIFVVYDITWIFSEEIFKNSRLPISLIFERFQQKLKNSVFFYSSSDVWRILYVIKYCKVLPYCFSTTAWRFALEWND